MQRILPVLTVLLVVVLLLGRATRTRVPDAAGDLVAEAPILATEAVRAPPPGAERPGGPLAPGGEEAAPPSDTPAIDRLVTLANRQRIDREARYTYIDSLLVESDSLIRRWPNREGRPLRVFLQESPDLPGWQSDMPGIIRRAMSAWQEVLPDLRFEVVLVNDRADIEVHWIERFEIERTGQTDLQYRPTGEIQHGTLILALQTRQEQVLPPEGMLAVAVHEFGHVLGLPHSSNLGDVMYPETRTSRISARDRATLVLLYALAPGSLRINP